MGVLIVSFMSPHSFNISFTETNSSRLIFELIKSLKIKTSFVFNLGSSINTILSWFFVFSVNISLCFLILAVIALVYNASAELAIPIGMPANTAKSEIETHLVITEAKMVVA